MWISTTEVVICFDWISGIGTCVEKLVVASRESTTGIPILYFVVATLLKWQTRATLLDRAVEFGGRIITHFSSEIRLRFEVDWYAKHGAEFLKDTEYPALPGFSKSFVTYQPLGSLDSGDGASVSLQMAQHHCLKSSVGQFCEVEVS